MFGGLEEGRRREEQPAETPFRELSYYWVEGHKMWLLCIDFSRIFVCRDAFTCLSCGILAVECTEGWYVVLPSENIKKCSARVVNTSSLEQAHYILEESRLLISLTFVIRTWLLFILYTISSYERYRQKVLIQLWSQARNKMVLPKSKKKKKRRQTDLCELSWRK